jgi:hypothetical protein
MHALKLGYFVDVIPIPAWKFMFHPIKSRLVTCLSASWLFAHTAIFITAFHKNVVLLTPGKGLALTQCTQIYSMAYAPTIIHYGK